MKKGKIKFLAMVLIVVAGMLLIPVNSSAGVYVVIDEICYETLTDICKYVDEQGNYMCSFPGRPVPAE